MSKSVIWLSITVVLAALCFPSMSWAGKDKGNGNLTQGEKDRLNAYVLSLIRKNQDVPPPPPPPPPPKKNPEVEGPGAQVQGPVG